MNRDRNRIEVEHMGIFTGFLLIICVLFYVYKAVLAVMRYKNKINDSDKDIKLINWNLDARFHATPSFDFPNIQSESDLKILNSGSNPCDVQEEIQVKQYCKY